MTYYLRYSIRLARVSRTGPQSPLTLALCLAGESMNELFSQNWEAVFQELKPLVDETISAILTDVARKVFERFPFAELFPVS